ncbi:phosphonatase-like hydrolase [Pseudolysinimonas sp.]|uniref:phosphonatase-like hydrolase n=1 Tax=Pseudolysinimonas sp. TaxID=2680009 RepID=UPI003F7F2293
MIDLVALDMAGTTIDDHGSVYVALQRCVEETGATVATEDLQRWMGTDKTEAIGALMRLGGADPTTASVEAAFGRFHAILAELYREQPPVALPGVEDALRTLRDRGVRIALTTGFDDDVALPLLEALGWHSGVDGLLDAVVTTSDVTAGRPAPYLIHHAMELTGVTDVRRVIAAGDTVVDVQAATNAGVIAVAVLTGALAREDFEGQPYDHLLDSVADIPHLDAARA